DSAALGAGVEAPAAEEEGRSVVAKKERESNGANVEGDSKDGNEEGSWDDTKAENNAQKEAKEGNDHAKNEANGGVKEEEANAAANEEDRDAASKDDKDHNVNKNLESSLEERIRLPVLDLDKGCSVIMDLMDKLAHIFRQGLSNSFFPVAFEGWSPHAQDIVYRVLVPLSPPLGHAFHLELNTAGMLQRNFCVHVELLCTCTREQLGEDMLCFLHHPKEELRRRQDPSLLHTLCTGAYLDVEKTVPCRSRHPEHSMARDIRRGRGKILQAHFQAGPQDSWHCKCLQPLTRFQMGIGFSSYALKTVVVHLLNTVPLTQWRRGDFRQSACPPASRWLNHQTSFQHLASNPNAHAKAV
ncbi:hypothetical protein HGM15179_021848, partial [Zosterops borbonicus]